MSFVTIQPVIKIVQSRLHLFRGVALVLNRLLGRNGVTIMSRDGLVLFRQSPNVSLRQFAGRQNTTVLTRGNSNLIVR